MSSSPADGGGPPPTATGDPVTDAELPGPPRLAVSGAWNLALSLLSKSQSLALPAAGAIVGGLEGVGVAAAAIGACWLGAALADFGLVGELGRLSVTHPTRPTIRRCVRALSLQAPLGLLIAPLVFYLALGHRTGAPVELLAATGALSAFLAGTTGLTAILNGLGDFRSPAIWAGSMRFVSGFVAVGGAIAVDSPAVIIGAFAAGEGAAMVALGISLRRVRAALSARDDPTAVVRRTHVWLGVASIINILTSQSDTLLVAPILEPDELGLFAIASLLGNGVATLSLAPSTPFSFRVISATADGDPPAAHGFRRQAFVVAGAAALALALVTWIVTQVAGGAVDALSALADGDAPLVFGLYLVAAIPFVLSSVCVAIGVGFARHRGVGMAEIVAGGLGVGFMTAGAATAGAVGAAAGTLVRDGVLLYMTSRVIANPPAPEELRSREPDPEPA
jgi:O-antigen/teichoic acid export membrane protein